MPHYIRKDACVGCGVCEIKCPTYAIAGIKKELYKIDWNLCVDCRACAIWCPYDAIEDETGGLVHGLKAKEIPRAEVRLEFCNGCEWCIDACPFEAIRVIDHPYGTFDHAVEVIPNKCTACRECEKMCPGKDAIFVPEYPVDYMDVKESVGFKQKLKEAEKKKAAAAVPAKA